MTYCVFWSIFSSCFITVLRNFEDKRLPEGSLWSQRSRTKSFSAFLASSELSVVFIISTDTDQKSGSRLTRLHTSRFYKHCLEDGIVMKFLTQERFASYLDNSWKMNSIEENIWLNKLKMKHCDFRTMKGDQYSMTMRVIFCLISRSTRCTKPNSQSRNRNERNFCHFLIS